MPIGNLTSQIFANIYLNELDRFVKHELKIKKYLRYGDDFILIEQDLQKLERARTQVIYFLQTVLNLDLNLKHDRIMKARQGLKFLGVMIYPHQRKLTARNLGRIKRRISHRNFGSYYGLITKHGKPKLQKEFAWLISELIHPDMGDLFDN